MLTIIRQTKTALIVLIFFFLLTGFIYPLIVRGLAMFLFPWQASGSLLSKNNELIGSNLIGQAFDQPNYFWGRPSATPYFPYNAAYSSGSNEAPTNPDFIATVTARVNHIRSENPNSLLIPVDLVTASGSGLDPDISPFAAFFQAARIAKLRGIPESEIQALIEAQIKNRPFGVLGEPRVNVLKLNLALDQLRSSHA